MRCYQVFDEQKNRGLLDMHTINALPRQSMKVLEACASLPLHTRSLRADTKYRRCGKCFKVAVIQVILSQRMVSANNSFCRLGSQ